MKSIRSGIGAVIEEVQYESPRRILRFIEKELSVLVPATNFTMMDMMFRIVSLFGRTEELSWEGLSLFSILKICKSRFNNIKLCYEGLKI